MQDECLHRYFYCKDGSGSHLQFFIPHSMKTDILYKVHNTIVLAILAERNPKKSCYNFFSGMACEMMLIFGFCDTTCVLRINSPIRCPAHH